MIKKTRRLAICVAAVAVLTGCGADRSADQSAAPGQTRPSKAAHPHAAEPLVDGKGRAGEVDEPHAGAGLLESRTLSDLTVTGTVTAVRDGVTDPTEPRFTLALVTIRPDEVFKGTPGREIQMVMMSTFGSEHRFNLPGQPIPEVGTLGTWFLKRVPASAPIQGYLPISTGAQVLFDTSGRVTSRGDQAALAEAERLGTRDRISALLRTAGS